MSTDRRTFLKSSAAVAGAAAIAAQIAPTAYAAGDSKTLRIALVGCGGRGRGAVQNACEAAKGRDYKIEIVALADAFPDRLHAARDGIKGWGENKVTDDSAYAGFDGYKKVCARNDVDIVLCATPPYFRPYHLMEVIKNGKHAFIEKPVAVDPFGVRMVIEAAKLATEKKLSIVCGTQRRHQKEYVDSIKALHEGGLGQIINFHGYWNQGGLWSKTKADAAKESGKPIESISDMELQMRNWLYYTWLSGDHIVEQHVHQLDIMQWVFKDQLPEKVTGLGGRQARIDAKFGNIYDHFGSEFEYKGGHRCLSMARQIDGCANRVTEYVQCEKGRLAFGEGKAYFIDWDGKKVATFDGGRNPYDQEHMDLHDSILGTGPALNEGERIAHSTLCAIMARESCYTGKEVTSDFMLRKSQLKIGPEGGADLAFGDFPVPPVAMPGSTKLV